jgi:hypothetical protein
MLGMAALAGVNFFLNVLLEPNSSLEKARMMNYLCIISALFSVIPLISRIYNKTNCNDILYKKRLCDFSVISCAIVVQSVIPSFSQIMCNIVYIFKYLHYQLHISTLLQIIELNETAYFDTVANNRNKSIFDICCRKS